MHELLRKKQKRAAERIAQRPFLFYTMTEAKTIVRA
jgi:hypothetical protein